MVPRCRLCLTILPIAIPLRLYSAVYRTVLQHPFGPSRTPHCQVSRCRAIKAVNCMMEIPLAVGPANPFFLFIVRWVALE